MTFLGDQLPISPVLPETTLTQVVQRRARSDAHRTAYTFLVDGDADARSLTWSELDARAGALGAKLRRQGAGGRTVLLALPSGLAFVESLFACWYAGAIAVPMSLPRHHGVRHRLHHIIADAGAQFAIGTAAARERLEERDEDGARHAQLTWISPEGEGERQSLTGGVPVPAPRMALLQYTSGSTGAPRGVMVTHANLMRNGALIAEACGHGPDSTIGGWLPLFHDMGLVGLVLQGAYTGARCVFTSPERFLMRPSIWLKMISDYGICSSPAPNFAYDLCAEKIRPEQKAQLDLSSWRNALNGSEPVRPSTLERFASAFASCGFRRESFFPCYGLAEATLFVTGPGTERQLVRRTRAGQILSAGTTGGHVACGRTFGDTRLAIVNPQTARQVPAGTIGEIWLAGESCAAGYWNNPEATEATFHARLADPGENGAAHVWLRTGDLGFVADGELFITGRRRELIILFGRNFFPVDLERTAESADGAIAASGVGAFSVDAAEGERLVIVAEVRRDYRRRGNGETPGAFDPEEIRRRVRAAIVAEHDVAPHEVVLLRPGALPRTTSNKISRRAAHDAYLNQTLARLDH